jgi:hypothetical protein
VDEISWVQLYYKYSYFMKNKKQEFLPGWNCNYIASFRWLPYYLPTQKYIYIQKKTLWPLSPPTTFHQFHKYQQNSKSNHNHSSLWDKERVGKSRIRAKMRKWPSLSPLILPNLILFLFNKIAFFSKSYPKLTKSLYI